MTRRLILLLIALLGWAPLASAQTYTISPSPFLLAQNNSGQIINNACIWTYAAGTTTAATTYADAAGTPNLNPIRSDSAGRFTAFLSPGNSYKYVYESACVPPAHGTTLRTADNISAMPPNGVNVDIAGTAGETINAGSAAYLSDGSGSLVVGKWYNATSANTYSSSAALEIGFATVTITTGNTGSFRTAGRITALSGLVGGSRYYVGASPGAITATAPANQRFVGVADSATSLLIAPNPSSVSGFDIGTGVSGAVLTATGVGTAPTWNAAGVGNRGADGRLTGTTNTCITTADVTSTQTIFYTPCTGNRIALFDGTATWNVRTFAEISISIAACTASKPYDVFLFDMAGVVTAETLVWTNDTTRATALIRQDGVWVKTGATTRRYVGSFYCNAAGARTDDSFAKRNIFNADNRAPRILRRLETTASWTYTTAAFHQANASTANQVEVMIGLAEVKLDLAVRALSRNSAATASAIDMIVAIGEDSTSTAMTGLVYGVTEPSINDRFVEPSASAKAYPAVGHHFYAWLEESTATGTTTWLGTSLPNGAGLSGETGY